MAGETAGRDADGAVVFRGRRRGGGEARNNVFPQRKVTVWS